jgi:hypothetical protein
LSNNGQNVAVPRMSALCQSRTIRPHLLLNVIRQ